MDSVAAALVLGTVGGMALLGLWKGGGGYEAFLRGARDGLHTGVEILPALAAMMLLIGLIRVGGLAEVLEGLLALWQRLWISAGGVDGAAAAPLERGRQPGGLGSPHGDQGPDTGHPWWARWCRVLGNYFLHPYGVSVCRRSQKTAAGIEHFPDLLVGGMFGGGLLC